MKNKSGNTIVVNKITGKTIQEMSWQEIEHLLGEPISQKELIQRLRNSGK